MFFGRYEIQVLDSFENLTYADGQAAAIYGQYPPLVNASRPPGQWQTYDIIFTAPRFKRGRLARVAGLCHDAAQRRARAQPHARPRRRWPSAASRSTRHTARRGRSCSRTTATRCGSAISGSARSRRRNRSRDRAKSSPHSARRVRCADARFRADGPHSGPYGSCGRRERTNNIHKN